MLCIYAKESLCNAIQDVRWATNAVGVMGVMGNKGGVTCRSVPVGRDGVGNSVCYVVLYLFL